MKRVFLPIFLLSVVLFIFAASVLAGGNPVEDYFGVWGGNLEVCSTATSCENQTVEFIFKSDGFVTCKYGGTRRSRGETQNVRYEYKDGYIFFITTRGNEIRVFTKDGKRMTGAYTSARLNSSFNLKKVR